MDASGSGAPQTRALFDHLPDDVLLTILVYTIARETQFLIDNHSCYMIEKIEEVELDEGNPLITQFVGICRSLVYPSQRPHVDDWVLINTINKRFRGVGRQAFFQGKSFIMDSKLPLEIQAGRVPFLKESILRSIALENIKDVTLTFEGERTGTPVVFLALPKRIEPFTNLRRLTCLIGQQDWAAPGLIAIPNSWTKRLVDIGVSPDTKIRLMVTNEVMMLLGPIGTILELKARILKRAKEMKNE
ncbi:hypothetical protein RRF57_002867 [Xylaria bambusicola]|uniref:Uncharacterized protein n=1 Tax=Xylaria bambusicola TaxID=326684 RepID=A0AAN7Z273_9PEZI